MNWLTWRQHRIETLVGGMLLLFTLVILLISASLIISLPLKVVNICGNELTRCTQYTLFASSDAIDLMRFWTQLWFFLVPLLVGLFLGAPLIAREIEQGTFRLIWTQSVSRLRWLGQTVALLLVAIFLGSLLLALASTWWSSAWITDTSIISPWDFYDYEGMVLIGRIFFAFALGLAAGALVRKTFPAMGVTLLLFLLINIVIATMLRPHFLPPLHDITSPVQQLPPRIHSKTVSVGYIDAQGHQYSWNETPQACEKPDGMVLAEEWQRCLQAHGWHYQRFYQPIERFWLFQAIESSLYLILTCALVGLTFWLVRKRLA